MDDLNEILLTLSTVAKSQTENDNALLKLCDEIISYVRKLHEDIEDLKVRMIVQEARISMEEKRPN